MNLARIGVPEIMTARWPVPILGLYPGTATGNSRRARQPNMPGVQKEISPGVHTQPLTQVLGIAGSPF